jgi:hypothetical protein
MAFLLSSIFKTQSTRGGGGIEAGTNMDLFVLLMGLSHEMVSAFEDMHGRF